MDAMDVASQASQATQHIPVKMYRSDERLVVAAPMPGLEPSDIQATIKPDGQLSLHGRLRGEFKGDKDVLLDEWAVGDYERVLSLPLPVDGGSATVTYGNGVLVVSMPIAAQTTPATLSANVTLPHEAGQ
jgi:HSP20 family protein